MTELEQQLTARLGKAKEVFRSQKTQIEEKDATITAQKAEIEKLTTSLAEYKEKENDNGEKFFDQVEEINTLNLRIAHAELEISEKTAKVKELETLYAEEVDKNIALQDDLNVATTQASTLRTELDKVTEAMSTIADERDELNKKIEKMQSDYKKNTTKLMGRVEEKREELEKVVTSIQNFSNGLHEDFNIFA